MSLNFYKKILKKMAHYSNSVENNLFIVKKLSKIAINDLETSEHNRDLCEEGLQVAKDNKNVLEKISKIIEENNNQPLTPTTPTTPTSPSAQPIINSIETNNELQKLGDCLWNISTLFSYAENIDANTFDVKKKIANLIVELNATTEQLRVIITGQKPKSSRWNGSIKGKIRTLGKFSLLVLNKDAALEKVLSNDEIPIERLKSSRDSQIFGTTKDVEITRGSRNHIKLRWYTGIKRVSEKEVGNFKVDDVKYKLMIEEVDFMKKLSSCLYVLTTFGYCQHPSGFSVISRWEEYNLQTYLIEHRDLDWTEKLFIARGIVNALDYCHKENILHHDVQTKNVLLDQNLQPKLYNFRIDKKPTVILECSNAPLDTPRYSSPERIRGEKYDKKSETYSFAMVLWEIEHHEMPYEGFTFKVITEKILKGEYPSQKFVRGTPVEYQNIIEKAWAQDPKRRSDMKSLFDDIDELDSNYLKEKVDLIGQSIELSEELEDLGSPVSLTATKPDYVSAKGTVSGGIDHHKNKRYKAAWKIFKEASKSKPNDADVNYWLGYYHLKGWHEERKGVKGIPEKTEGVGYLKSAAESGHASAQYLYATTILNGISKNGHKPDMAMRFLKESAKQDHPGALRMLGGIIMKGNYGLSFDPLMGKALIERSRNIRVVKKDEYKNYENECFDDM